MNAAKPEGNVAVAEHLGAWIADVNSAALPAQTVEMARLLLLDVTGLCVAVRDED
ncbi:MAG TPA: hypothetical protein VEI25_19065 [Paraburkholderia sp.]|nr:hypothetical protein [Paraburkholderia sp.]